MPARYSFEKGKYGIFPGTIVAFSRKLDGSNPTSSDWTETVPAGYLRCDGSIKNAIDFPELAKILGVGESSKFRKSNIILDEEDEGIYGGQFQLPDLGSKHITASTSSGRYDSLTTVSSNEAVFPRAGVSVELDLNQGSSLEIIYEGKFNIPSIPLNISAGRTFVSNLPSALTPQTVGIASFLTHGHYGNYPQSFLQEPAKTSDGGCDNVNQCSTIGRDVSPDIGAISLDRLGPQSVGVGGSLAGTEHSHSLPRTTVTRTTTQNTIATDIDAFNISTTVNLSVDNTFKIDDIVSKFILVEYLIKI